MRTKVETTTVYKFDELSDEAKEHAINRMRDINVDYDWYTLDEYITGFTPAECAKHHLTDKESELPLLSYKHLYFDLGRGEYIQFADCEFSSDETARKFLGVPKNIWERVYWSFENKDYGGSSHGSTKLIWEDNYSEDREFTSKQLEIIERAVSRFDDKVQDAWKCLQDEYEYLTGKEAIIDTINANEYEFTEDGDIA